MGKKKKNKKHDIWDLSFEEQQENLRKFDEFLAGKTNDMFVNHGADFESQLFNMIDTRRSQDSVIMNMAENHPKKKYFDQYGIFQYNEDNSKSDITEPVEYKVLDYTPVSFDVDEALHMVFINSKFERVGLKLDTRVIPEEVVIENEHVLGTAFIDYSLFNTIPFAIADDIPTIIKVFKDYGIESYDKNKFKIIYDETEVLYRCYIVDTSSAGNLQANVIKSYREYAELLLELENRAINDIDWGYFYDSKYNNLDDFAKIIAMDTNTTTGDRPMTDSMAEEFGYIISSDDIYGVITPLLEIVMDDDEDDEEMEELMDDLDEVSEEELKHIINEVVDDIQPVVTTSETSTDPVETVEVPKEVVIDVDDLKDKMQTPEEPQPSSYLTPNISANDEDDETDEEEPTEVPEEIEVTEENMDNVDFDDLTSVPVIRKPKKK